MYTVEDKNNIKKYLKDGNYGEILLMCMMRNGATVDEFEEMRGIVCATDDYKLNTIVKYVAAYYNLNAVLNDDYH